MGGIRRLERSIERATGKKKKRRPDARARRRMRRRSIEHGRALAPDASLSALMLLALARLVHRSPFYRRVAK